MKNKGSLWAGLLALLLAAPAAAIIQPQVINFQGKLLDPTTNLPKTGLVGLTFNLYRSLTGGTALWTETQSNVALTNGVFAVELGTYTALPPDLFLGASVYLGVTVVGDAAGEMSPRSRLAMSPYAFTANQLSDTGSVNLVADAVYSTFTNAGNLILPGGVSASSAAFTNGVNATSGTFTQFVAASSGIFTASGSGTTFALTASSGLVVQQGTLDMNGGGGISNTYGLWTGTLTVIGNNLSVGGSSFTVSGGTATVAYGLSASNVSAGNALHVASMTAGGFLKFPYWTLAQIQAYTPVAADLGGIVTCTNCGVPYNICTASGTTINGFRLSTGTATCK